MRYELIIPLVGHGLVAASMTFLVSLGWLMFAVDPALMGWWVVLLAGMTVVTMIDVGMFWTKFKDWKSTR